MGSRSRNTGGGGSFRQSHTQPSPLAVPRMKSLVLILCLFLACGPLVSGLFWGDADSDGDGIADEDEDHDGDGVSNDDDEDDDGDGVLDVDEDDDADGVENDEDPDDDGDGVLDENDEL